MWLQSGSSHQKDRMEIVNNFNRPTSDGRYSAILLYFLRNKELGDYQAISMVRDRLPNDIVHSQEGLVYRI